MARHGKDRVGGGIEAAGIDPETGVVG